MKSLLLNLMKIRGYAVAGVLANLFCAPLYADQLYEFEYNSQSQIVKQTSPSGGTTRHTYNTDGTRATTTNAKQQVTKYNSYDSSGHVTSVTDPNGINTLMTYHPRGGLQTITRKHPSDSALDATTRMEYDVSGRLMQVTQPSGQVTHYEYTDADQVSAVVNDEGERIEYEVDQAGNRTKQIIKNARGETTYSVSQSFDELSRPIETNGNHGQTTNITYDAGNNPESQTNAKQHKTQREFDLFDRLIKETDPAGGETQYSYQQGNIHTITDARGNTTTYDYNEMGDLVKLTSPDTGVTTFEYDDAHNVIEKIDARHIVTQFTYDSLDRPVIVSYPDAPLESLILTYDESSTNNAGIGKLTSIRKYGAGLNYEFNSLGLVSKKTVEIQGLGKEKLNAFLARASKPQEELDSAGNVIRATYISGLVVTYSYTDGKVTGASYTFDTEAREAYLAAYQAASNSDIKVLYEYSPGGELTKLTYPNGRIVNYAYHKGKLVGITTQTNSGTSSQSILSNIEYLPFGPAQSYTFGNGLAETRSYDTDYRLVAVDVGHFNLSYSFNSVDNIDQIINNLLPTPTQTFGYDSLDRLTSASGSYGNLNWSYDHVGNRLSETRNGATDWYAYSPTSNRLNSISRSGKEGNNRRRSAVINGNRQFLYDEAGNTKMSNTEDGTQQVNMFNQAGRLSGVAVNPKSGGPFVTYLYNPLGERVSKSVNGVLSEAYIWDEAGHLLQVLNSNGESVRDYIYFGEQQIAVVMKGEIFYLHNDHLGVAQVITNAAQEVVSVANFEPFGKLVSAGVDIGSRLPGQFLDKETGLFYNYFRDYDPSIGRYIESDPIGLAGGINTYGYTGGNPVSFIDPTGLNGVTAFGGALTEIYNYASGNPYDFGSVFGALKDGYNGEGDGFLKSAGEDALSFAGSALGAAAKVCKLVSAARKGRATTTLYRAVEPEEFLSLMASNKFAFGPNSSTMKQFGFKFDEVLAFANWETRHAAIISVEVPNSVLKKLSVTFGQIDPGTFRSGVVTAEGQKMLDILNKAVISIKHAL